MTLVPSAGRATAKSGVVLAAALAVVLGLGAAAAGDELAQTLTGALALALGVLEALLQALALRGAEEGLPPASEPLPAALALASALPVLESLLEALCASEARPEALRRGADSLGGSEALPEPLTPAEALTRSGGGEGEAEGEALAAALREAACEGS